MEELKAATMRLQALAVQYSELGLAVQQSAAEFQQAKQDREARHKRIQKQEQELMRKKEQAEKEGGYGKGQCSG